MRALGDVKNKIMAYATQDDLVPRRLTEQTLGQLTDDSGKDTINADVVTQVLTEASATVDSYVRLRYAVPLQPSEQIKGLTLDIAVYLLYSRRDRISVAVQTRYDNAIQFLRDVGAGKAGLDQPTGAADQTSGGPVVTNQNKCEKFSDHNLRDFV
jgi:phage gp36-like protein